MEFIYKSIEIFFYSNSNSDVKEKKNIRPEEGSMPSFNHEMRLTLDFTLTLFVASSSEKTEKYSNFFSTWQCSASRHIYLCKFHGASAYGEEFGI